LSEKLYPSQKVGVITRRQTTEGNKYRY